MSRGDWSIVGVGSMPCRADQPAADTCKGQAASPRTGTTVGCHHPTKDSDGSGATYPARSPSLTRAAAAPWLSFSRPASGAVPPIDRGLQSDLGLQAAGWTPRDRPDYVSGDKAYSSSRSHHCLEHATRSLNRGTHRQTGGAKAERAAGPPASTATATGAATKSSGTSTGWRTPSPSPP